MAKLTAHEWMTVAQLMDKLAAADPTAPVVIDCEVRGDPHPLTGLANIAGEVDDDIVWNKHVLLFFDDSADFERRTFTEDGDD